MNKRKVEVLAPAGSFDIMKAVVNAGADAVYLGGEMFGARAYAGNLNKEELFAAIEYAHIRDASIYLTVNTLLKEDELNNNLVDYLIPFYEAGLDAVIVQDLGVFRTIRRHFPKMHIHASTQMTTTGHMGANILKSMGASRIVTSRELSLDDITSIHNNCDIEIESFVHGALCYSYSGQCLLSSMNGDRSGNRGRCAQPCRLAYDAYDENMNRINDDKSKYVLSPKDICTIDILPDIIDAGVYSLKIEGRMKNVSYAAGVTAFFRKYVDMYLEKGRSRYKVNPNDIHDLMDLYNRGSFTTGYYNNNKGKNMISLARPNHMGTLALKVLNNDSGRITFKALEDINIHDVFEIDKDNSFSSGEAYKKGDSLIVNLPKKYNLFKGRQLYRTKSGKITENVQKLYVEHERKMPVNIHFNAFSGQQSKFIISRNDKSYDIIGDEVQSAVKQPISKDEITKRISKLGDTPYVIENTDVEIGDNIFISAGELNNMRRNAVSSLTESILSDYRRTYTAPMEEPFDDDLNQECFTSVLVSTIEQFKYCLTRNDVKRIYVEYTLVDEGNISKMLHDCVDANIQFYIALPHIVKESRHKEFINYISNNKVKMCNGFLVRNLESLCLVGQHCPNATIVTDAGLYTFNGEAKACIDEICTICSVTRESFTIPLELSAYEIGKLNNHHSEMVVYSRYPLMISEQCVRKTFGLCDVNNNTSYLTMNKFEKKYRVDSRCKYCYTILYDNSPVYLIDAPELLQNILPRSVRFEFTWENKEDVKRILDGQTTFGKEFNRGHFYAGLK